ncbi:MAG: DsbE family thiol:disulfide interchange protein [Rhodospirillales bacterium]|nr:MAG: DsbE family thiol:disulfide interchange protein [Rhodospirillales bacterium]
MTDLPAATAASSRPDGRASPGLRARLPFLIPLVVLAVVAAYFYVGLGRDPHVVPSVLINQPVPELALAPILGRDRGLTTADLKGEVSLLNVFGSWCVACRVEHPLLMAVAGQDLVPIHGVNWREPTPQAGPAWLARLGDPYTLVGADPDSRAAIALGVSGAPETFVIDRAGVIRYKHTGPITADDWERTLWPIIQKLRAE